MGSYDNFPLHSTFCWFLFKKKTFCQVEMNRYQVIGNLFFEGRLMETIYISGIDKQKKAGHWSSGF